MSSGVAGALLHAVNAAAGRSGQITFWLMLLAAAVGYGVVAIVVRGRATAALRATVASIGLCQGFALLTAEWAEAAGDTGWLQWLGSWLWAPGYLAIVAVLPLLLPDGRLLSARWRGAVALSLLVVIGSGARWALTPYSAPEFDGALSESENPVGVLAMTDPVLDTVFSVLTAAAVIAALASVVVRWRRSVAVERQQLKWVVLAFAATLGLIALSFGSPPEPAQAIAALAVLPLPGAIAVAVLRFGLWDVDTVASRALTYAAAAAVTAATFAAVRWGFGLLSVDDPQAASLLAAVIAGLVTVAVFAALQRSANRLVHRSPDEPVDVLARLGDRLGAAADADEIADLVLPVVLAELTRVLHADGASLALADGSTIGTAVPFDPSVPTQHLSLRHGGDPVGTLTVARADGFDTGERQLLDRLAGQAAVAAHTVLLERRLRLARQEVVLAREEERRRLRRDLHDGVGPSLAAVALQLETARDLATDDPAASAVLLDRLTPRVNALVADVRALVHELRPPTLDELGLAPAVGELAARLSNAGTRVEATALALGPLPAAVEVAAYRIAGEAATNAVRHADAGLVRIELHRDADGLVVRVDDDGAGLAPVDTAGRPGSGVGIASMRQRIEEVGGSLRIASGGGGTTITAILPAPAIPDPARPEAGDGSAPPLADRMAVT